MFDKLVSQKPKSGLLRVDNAIICLAMEDNGISIKNQW